MHTRRVSSHTINLNDGHGTRVFFSFKHSMIGWNRQVMEKVIILNSIPWSDFVEEVIALPGWKGGKTTLKIKQRKTITRSTEHCKWRSRNNIHSPGIIIKSAQKNIVWGAKMTFTWYNKLCMTQPKEKLWNIMVADYNKMTMLAWLSRTGVNYNETWKI